jgi:hypothetical protein
MKALTSAQYRKELTRDVQGQLSKLVPEDARDWCDVEPVEAGTPYRHPQDAPKHKIDLLVMNTTARMLDRTLGSTGTRRERRNLSCAADSPRRRHINRPLPPELAPSVFERNGSETPIASMS